MPLLLGSYETLMDKPCVLSWVLVLFGVVCWRNRHDQDCFGFFDLGHIAASKLTHQTEARNGNCLITFVGGGGLEVFLFKFG